MSFTNGIITEDLAMSLLHVNNTNSFKKGLSTLTSVAISYATFEKGAFDPFIVMLSKLTSLKFLFLYDSKIGDDECVSLAEMLPSMPMLTILDLKYNNIGDKGCSALAEVLPRMKALEYLILSTNHIGDDGAKALAKVLSSVPTLKNLDLRTNYINKDGATALGDAFSSKTDLKLIINGNPFDTEIAKKLISKGVTVE